jgi:hypothetical protein
MDGDATIHIWMDFQNHLSMTNNCMFLHVRLLYTVYAFKHQIQTRLCQ